MSDPDLKDNALELVARQEAPTEFDNAADAVLSGLENTRVQLRQHREYRDRANARIKQLVAQEKLLDRMARIATEKAEIVSGIDAYVCPRCGAVSHNPTDVAEGYCAKCHDWTRDPEWKAYTTHVRTELVPKIEGASIGISIVPVRPEDVDVKFAVELGLMVMLDKPIMLLVDPTTIIPEHLQRVADEIVVYDAAHPDHEAVLAAMRRMGVDAVGGEPS